MTELPGSLVGLQRALRLKKISYGEAIAAQRERLIALDQDFNAVVELLPACGSAAPAGKLTGIALAHKDIFNTLGRKPGLGHDKGHVAPTLQDAAVIKLLSQHGASPLAALTMAEYACGATGENSHFERCINPLRAQAVVGGSSSGSAVAVASHMTYASLATDTAGSVRIPAATCGLVGLKTSHGLVSLEGVYPLAPSLDSVGVLTRSAADALEMLLACVAPQRLRPAASALPRLQAWLPASDLSDSVAAALEGFVKAQGLPMRSALLPEYQTLTRLSEIVLHTEAARTHRSDLLEGVSSAAVESIALPGLVIPGQWYEAALADRARRARAFVQEHLTECDILIAPALAGPVPDWDEVTPGNRAFESAKLRDLYRFMGFVNYLGLPSLVVPVAVDARGMPISVQLIGRPFHEPMLLKFAQQVELQYD